MLKPRLIPVLLLSGTGFVKTVKFGKQVYLGDAINIVKIFNEKEVDEIIILDITATKEHREPNFNLIEEIISEAFMPVCYGGGVKNFEHAKRLFRIGVEKISINSVVNNNISLIKEISDSYGSQSVVVSIDIEKNFFGKYHIKTHSGTKKIKTNITKYLEEIQNIGAGEILINSINNDGLMNGYDLELLNLIPKDYKIPVVICGGAGALKDFKVALDYGASSVAAGSFFVFQGPLKAVLITYPNYVEFHKFLND
jgi:cyclase